MIGLQNGLFDFQQEAVEFLISTTSKNKTKQIITLKAPTGAGKTIIIIKFIDEYLCKVTPDTAFIWLCPGKGDLEEQSRLKMMRHLPTNETKNLFDALRSGFNAGSTTFINWELVTKKDNNAIKEVEKKNLFERIAEAHRNGVNFIVIIDEEHSNNTNKAKIIIDAFAAEKIIRVSATAQKNFLYEFYEIDELSVIDEGLITRAICVNEGIEDNMAVDDNSLIELADMKRKHIINLYNSLGKDINPLVLIQFPSGQPDRIKEVEKKLESLGYTYDNQMVSIWMSEDKRDLPNNLTENNATQAFLLMKQAISTGWDCPRAKILVKLREGGDEVFQIQTIGRIRRMPEAVHYNITELDMCYVYTFDEQYKAGLLSSTDKAYVSKRLFLKDKCKTFQLHKELRNLEYDGLSERDVLYRINDYYRNSFKLTKSKDKNRQLLFDAGYVFGTEILGKAMQGEFIRSSSLLNEESIHYITTKTEVDTSKHGFILLQVIDELKTLIGMPSNKVRSILERLFKNNGINKDKYLALSTKEFYAFVINNKDKLKRDFKEVTAEMVKQLSFTLEPRKAIFKIPEQDFYRYDPSVKSEFEMISNSYHEYTSGFITSKIRSKSEQMFEKYCDTKDDIDWVYKNGDSGQQYLSIVYYNGIEKQRLFYPDYIVKKNDGSIWIIETKGGELQGKDMNIDPQIGNKFNAFKRYAADRRLSWGFIRNLDGELYINNTEFHEDMSNDSWVILKDMF